MSSHIHLLTTYVTSHFLRECLNPNQAKPFNQLDTGLQDTILKALHKTKNADILDNYKILYYNRCLFDLHTSSLDGLLFCDNAVISFSPLHPFQQLRIVMYNEIISTTPVYTNMHVAHYRLPEVLVRLVNGSVVRLSVEKDYSIYQLDALLLDIRHLLSSGTVYPRFSTFEDFLAFYQYRLKRNPIILHPSYFDALRLHHFCTYYPIPSNEQMIHYIELIPSTFESGILFTSHGIYLRLPGHPFIRLPYHQIVGCRYNGDRTDTISVLLSTNQQYIIEPLELLFNHDIQANPRYMAEMFTDIISYPSLFYSEQDTLKNA